MYIYIYIYIYILSLIYHRRLIYEEHKSTQAEGTGPKGGLNTTFVHLYGDFVLVNRVTLYFVFFQEDRPFYFFGLTRTGR